MKEQQIIDFLKLRNYDIRKTQNALDRSKMHP